MEEPSAHTALHASHAVLSLPPLKSLTNSVTLRPLQSLSSYTVATGGSKARVVVFAGTVLSVIFPALVVSTGLVATGLVAAVVAGVVVCEEEEKEEEEEDVSGAWVFGG